MMFFFCERRTTVIFIILPTYCTIPFLGRAPPVQGGGDCEYGYDYDESPVGRPQQGRGDNNNNNDDDGNVQCQQMLEFQKEIIMI